MYLLITHNDLDGVGCGVVAKTMLDEPLDIIYSSNDDVDDNIINAIGKIDLYKKILITDLSPRKEETIDLMQLHTRKIKLLDHHKTALDLNAHSFANVQIYIDDHMTCGTELLYLYLSDLILNKYKDNPMMFVNYSERRLRFFVELVRKYDTWEWKTETLEPDKSFSKMLNDLLGLITKDEFTESMYDSIMNDRTFFPKRYLNLLEQEEVVRNKYLDNKLKNVTIKEWEGYTVGFIIAEKYTSELGSLICSKLDVDIAVMITENSVSLRSIDVDVSAIAKERGGGGHYCASGFPINKNKLFKYLFAKGE